MTTIQKKRWDTRMHAARELSAKGDHLGACLAIGDAIDLAEFEAERADEREDDDAKEAWEAREGKARDRYVEELESLWGETRKEVA